MNPNITQEINLLRELLNSQGDLGIVIGSHQNLDTYAAGLSLYASLKASGKKVQIISKKAPTVEVSNLVGIDKVRDSFVSGNNSKLVISLPYIKGEVEKVLFTEFPNPQNPTNINFHLTAAEGKSITPFSLSDVKLLWEGGAPGAVITIGVSYIDELAGIADDPQIKIVNIDNFSGSSRFGDVVLVDESFSSLSEVSAKIIKDLALPVDIDSAQNVLDGVLFATRNFTKPNTSPLAFEAASTAMYNGARRNDEKVDVRQEQRQNPRPQRYQDRQDDQRGTVQQKQRVGDTDFPAMHMQGSRNQGDDRRQRNQQRGQEERGRRPQNQPQTRQFQDRSQRPQQAFGQNPKDIEELMRKINEENMKKQQPRRDDRQQPVRVQEDVREDEFEEKQNEFTNPQIQDAQIVDDRRQVQDDFEPEQAPYTPPDPSEVPDDWLTPKVFKSSKRNN